MIHLSSDTLFGSDNVNIAFSILVFAYLLAIKPLLVVGNIAVHLFLEETRRMYDLETLWTVGVDHDDLSQDIMYNVTTSTTREEFSFDAELERLYKLRGCGTSTEQTEKDDANSMENQGNWHQQ